MLAKLKACEGQGACSCINCAQLLGLFGLGFRFLLLLGLYFILFRCIFVACQPRVVCGGGREVCVCVCVGVYMPYACAMQHL